MTLGVWGGDGSAPREPGIGRLARIPIRECGEPLVDLRKECPFLVLTCRLPFVRATVAELLRKAHEGLPEGWRLKVHTALRTLEEQSAGYWNHYKKLQEEHPNWPRSILRREANKFWHPPDMKAPPGHCTGGAVDVGLLDAEGAVVDVTSTVKEGLSSQRTYSRHLTAQARANRLILIQAMTAAGFSNCADEWWHWSYGDSAWAGRTGAPYAVYGLLRVLPPEVQVELAKLNEKGAADSGNREQAEDERSAETAPSS